MSTNAANQLYTFQTKTGLPVRVRRIQPDDAPFLVDIFEHMSSDSRYRRFHQAVTHVSPTRIWHEAEQIARADPESHDGLIAFADLPDQPDAPIAAVRYVVARPGEAEAAMSVRDDLQNMGVGTQLLNLLLQEAQAAGLRRLVASIQNDNQAIWHMLNRLPFPVRRKSEGAYSDIVVELTPP